MTLQIARSSFRTGDRSFAHSGGSRTDMSLGNGSPEPGVPGLWSHGPGQLLDWAPGASSASPPLVCCPPPHPSREAGCAGQLHEISHQPLLNLNHGTSLSALALPLSHTRTHAHTRTLTRPDSRSTRAENGVPAGQVAHDMQCRLPCHVSQYLDYPRAEHCA